MIFLSILSGTAAILIYVGLLFLIISLRRQDHAIYLNFALSSLFFGIHLIFKIITIQQKTISDIFLFFKPQVACEFLAAIFLIWMVAHYTGVKPRKLLWLITIISSLMVIFNLVLPYGTIWQEITGLQSVNLPWGESWVHPVGTPHPLVVLGAVNEILAFGFFFVLACFRQYQRGEHQKALILAFSLAILLISIIHIYLVDAGVLPGFFSTIPFAFVFMVIVMSLQLTDQIVKTERQLQHYNNYLEAIIEVKTQELQAAIEEKTLLKERNRITAELHDSVNQNLHSLVMISDSLPKLWKNHPQEIPSALEKISQIAQGSLIQMRNLLNELSPQRLLEKPLGQLLQQLSQEMASQAHFKLTTCIGPDCPLPPKVQITFYRIAQEAINNIVRHSQAQQVEIHFNCHHCQYQDKQVHLRIKDDGIGFEKEKSLPDHLGLTIMEQRARKIGAKLTITTQPAQGTEISVTWSEENSKAKEYEAI